VEIQGFVMIKHNLMLIGVFCACCSRNIWIEFIELNLFHRKVQLIHRKIW
jgi:hypothetical protein